MLIHAAFMPRIKTGRSESVQISLCDFSNADDLQKAGGSSDSTTGTTLTDEKILAAEGENSIRLQSEFVTSETRKEEEAHTDQEVKRTNPLEEVSVAKQLCEDKNGVCSLEKESVSTGKSSEDTFASAVSSLQEAEACTPNPQTTCRKQESQPTNSKKNQTAKKIASLVRNPSTLKPKNQSQLSQVKGVKPTSARSVKTVKNISAAPEFAQENQAIKRQKLDEGRSRQILNVHPQNLPHKSRLGLSSSRSNFCSSTTKTQKEDRKLYVREPAAPFVSTAELVKRFQSNTRNIQLPLRNSSLSHDDATSILQRRPKLTLTRPTEPEFETSHRVRSVRVKSSAELEEEMMANIPKFKARPINKKILEAPTLPALPRSTPQLPEFQEFHLKTMERASQHAETSSVVSATESSYQNHWNPHKLTEPRTPRLETLLRARPPKVKSSQELEQEELEKIPKFKARPLNKKIFESKGDLGIFCNPKRHVTKPQEFHFATDERIPPSKTVFELFDKLSLNSEPRHEHQLPRITTPNPFHLHTEERGAEKEKKFVVEVLQKQYEEERARIPKATPYPYTTDYPVIPPKPEPKQCTKPEPFQLESLSRHEEEIQREMEERRKMEKEEAQMRIFKAQPILREDPLPVPEKERKPLTEVQEFSLHVDHRAVDRAEFDKKIKEKEVMYKRYREEYESAKLMEEEKALKQLRRTMVPHARPIPKFDNPFHPQKSSKETTKAKSPNLRVLRRKEKRRIVGSCGVTTTATSAAASNMR
ncbi:TPX2 [Macleaya cordata]|uniref:TPX2 n=1 Tax=Macleaya cordata TaxID=56857 RepID=A0A200PQ71_MACCD|nr:TPX2 [Macleaya cordata]